jgi:co-chaperonin GroES (HSP10)
VFTPLPGRVLIKPDPPPTTTASGLHIAEDRKPEMTGTVVAVGPPDNPRHTNDVKPGDYVVFSWAVGQELWVNHAQTRLLILKESDILAVVEGAV